MDFGFQNADVCIQEINKLKLTTFFGCAWLGQLN